MLWNVFSLIKSNYSVSKLLAVTLSRLGSLELINKTRTMQHFSLHNIGFAI